MNRLPLMGGAPVPELMPGRAKKPCLLLVDDQPLNIQALYRVFSADHQVLMATSGEKALAICRETPPDLVLLDVMMPGMDGYEVLGHLKANPATAGIPVIFVTARDGAEDEARGLSLGAVDFIAKPINPAIVSARVRTHLELASARSLLGATLEATADGIAVIALEGGLVTCNQRFTRMWNAPTALLDAGAARAELRYIRSRMDDPDSEMGALLGAKDTRSANSADGANGADDTDAEEIASTVELRDGRILQRHRTPLRTHGKLTGHVLSFRDITERVRAERATKEVSAHLDELNADLEAKVRERTRELAEATRAASAANRAKGEFLSNMSHEMRTPMNSILGLSYLALRADPSPKMRDYLERISGSGQHLLSLISNVLDLSKIEAGKLDIEVVDFSAMSVMDDLLKQLSGLAQEKGLRLVVDADSTVAQPLRGDPLRIRQILLNFAGNAIKFSDRGEVRIRGRVQDRGGKVEALFEVQDQGIGLTQAQVGQLFQAFHQADASTTREYGGTGLGLAICRQLSELMGGEVGVRSEAGVGSTFWLRVPLSRGEFRPADAQYTGTDSRWDGALKGRTILVVDDNSLNQQVAFELLQATGAKVLLAGDGLMALQLLARFKADAVLMDVQMPVMDGLEATRRIRAETSLAGLCVIAMTANARGEDAAACRAAGMDDFLTKPVVPENMYATLVKWLGADARAAKAAAPHAPAHASTYAAASTPAAAGARGDAAVAGEVIDLSVLVQLTSSNPNMMLKIAKAFINSMERTVAELDAALAARDRAALAALGHKVKSSAGAVGAHGLSRLCNQLETSMSDKAADIDDARPLVAAIRALKDPIAEKLSALGA